MSSELIKKSQSTLELNAVLERLSEQAVSKSAKERAICLTPQENLWEIKEALREIDAAKTMMTLKGSPSMERVSDVKASLDRADRGGLLTTNELLRIAGVLRAARTVRTYGKSEREEETCLDYLFHALRGNKYLEDTLTNSIVGDGELADSASTDLANIRRNIKASGARVKDILQKIISSSTYSKALQEPIITMRSDRYVVPVKAESRSAIPGLVHDISASGATVFVEPMSVVEANNEIRELVNREQAEIQRILAEFSAQVAACRQDILSDFETLVDIDLIFAKARLSFDMDAAAPTVIQSGAIELRKARHPLLPVKSAVPIDIALGEGYDTLIITGPNTGGKTVSIKTLGLLCLMVRCGLHIPVSDGSTVPIFSKILADIGDEQSIEQSLSTFSSHMSNIVKILEECDDNTLLLLDELGAGTDPVEGAALAISIIEYARGLGVKIAATTHYAELKAYATTTDGVINASCEFDVETLRPTYRLLIGIPGKSNAFAIGSRLGMPQNIIADAQGRISKESAGFEEMIGKLDRQRMDMERDRLEITRELELARIEREKARKLAGELEKNRQDTLDAARAEARVIVNEAREISDQVVEEIKQAQKLSRKGMDTGDFNQVRADIRGKLNRAAGDFGDRREIVAPVKNDREIVAGDTVELLSIGTKAQVLSAEKDGTLNLLAGIMKISAAQDEVRLIESKPAYSSAEISARSGAQLRKMGTAPELDVRGMSGEEAMPVIERYLDSAVLSGLENVTIIHGKGTGKLRKHIHSQLKSMREIKSFRVGKYGEGEEGVTIITLK